MTATLYINGEWRPATDGSTFEVINPATTEILGHASDGTADDARKAVDSAQRAFDEWAGTTAYQRSQVLADAHRLMLENQQKLAQLMTREQGKPLRAASIEVKYASDFLAWFAEEAKRINGVTIPSSRSDQRFITMRRPVGVVAAITPWNYPISMLTRKLGPAIAAGCTSVLKPAAQTPLCAVATIELLVEAGLPPGVVNLVTTENAAPVGDVLLDSPKVRKLTFTGSTAVGKQLTSRAGETLKRVSVELGGHAPFIVFPDADPVRAAKGAALIKFLNTGQACISPNRFYVHRSIYDQFLSTLESRIRALKVGNGETEGVTIGPLIDERAVSKMESQVSDAVDKGGRLVVGGDKLGVPGMDGETFYAPTLLADVTKDMRISTEETFGPIAAVSAFDDEDEVIARANNTEYGLAAYIYTNDLSRAIRVTEKLKFGMVGVNDINPTSAAAPFGGTKASGLGREGGQEGIDEYLDTTLVGISV